MELINNFSDIFLSVWNKGILGVDIFQILIGLKTKYFKPASEDFTSSLLNDERTYNDND